MTEYRIEPPLKESPALHSCGDKSITIGKVFTSSTLMTKQMRYAENNYKEFSYLESEWANSPSKSISKALLNSIREAKIFSSVNSYRSRARNDLLLEANIDSFMQYYDEKKSSSYVKVALSLSLVDVKNVKALESTYIEKIVQSDSLNAEGGVNALNSALSEVLVATNLWLSEVCK
jgi:ABC-type uncharacterized transport system auxiliary subunit